MNYQGDILKIGITGSRKYQWYNRIINKLQSLDKNNLYINIGDANGIDKIVKKYCEAKQIPYKLYSPNNYNDPQEYYLRNLRIVNDSNMIIAFWNNESRGTRITIEIAKILNKPIEVINV